MFGQDLAETGMELQSVCDDLVDETEGLVVCVLLDLETGLTLAQASRPGVEPVAVESVGRAAGTMFRGKLIGQFVRSLPTPRSIEGFVREAQITTANTYRFMSTLPGWNNALLVFVTDKTVSIGLGWMAVHQAFDRLLQARPGSVATVPAASDDVAVPSAPTAARASPVRTAQPVATPPAARRAAQSSARGPRRPAAAPSALTQTKPLEQQHGQPPTSRNRRRPAVEPPAVKARPERGAIGNDARRGGTGPAPEAGRAERPDEVDTAKSQIGRLGARAGFGSKTKR